MMIIMNDDNNSSNVIKLTHKEYSDLYSQVFSKALRVEGEVMDQFGKREIELFYKYLDFEYKILTVIGIVAGFGFTAIPRVSSIIIFLLGEGLLFSSIISGLYWLKRIYTSNIENIQNSSKELSELYLKRDDKIIDINKKFNENYITSQDKMGEISKKDFQDYQDLDFAILKQIRDKIEIRNKTSKDTEKDIELLNKSIMWFFITGSVLLLMSFLPVSLYNKKQMIKILTNINFWGALCGLIGTIMLFKFGLPPKLNPEGHIYIIAEQEDKNEQKKYKKYLKFSYIALGLIALSFLLPILRLVGIIK